MSLLNCIWVSICISDPLLGTPGDPNTERPPMWLLSTDRAELHFFASPEAVSGGYAILSHTWGKHEQTFQETQALREKCEKSGENPRSLSTSKVRKSCILAERHGYRWLWNDTCCIDKTSSSELSEAINSMFRWYECAEMCFAYLGDVKSSCVLDAPGSSFRTARWHSRGWTLQELIAPAQLIFVSRDWKAIGNKVKLAELLQEITGVWWQVLTREMHYSATSIAERMSWASKRNTTRVEDEAYCLMGLFNVMMPTIYGEGRQAFQRLQHEIMKQSFDTSLFVWGGCLPQESGRIRPVGPSPSQDNVYLLAPSPKFFTGVFGQTVRYTPSARILFQSPPDQRRKKGPWRKSNPSGSLHGQLGPFDRGVLPRFSATSYGVACHFPIIESDGLTVAVLFCDSGREHLGLLLHLSNEPVQDSSRKKYYTGYSFRLFSGTRFIRFLSLGNDLRNLQLNGKVVTAEWRNIFIATSPPPIKSDIAPGLAALHNIAPAPPFRVPQWLIGRLTAVGMELQPLQMQTDPLRASLWFLNLNAMEGIRLVLGCCTRSRRHGRSGQHWAKAIVVHSTNWNDGWDYTHDCRQHHVRSWTRWLGDFGDADRTVRLSFSRCTLTPHRTLVVHVELRGQVYKGMNSNRGVAFPSRSAVGLGEDAVGPIVGTGPNDSSARCCIIA